MGRDQPPSGDIHRYSADASCPTTPHHTEETAMSVSQIPRWRTTPAAAKRAGISTWLLRKEIAEGRLRARRVGRLLRVLDSDLAIWMEGLELGADEKAESTDEDPSTENEPPQPCGEGCYLCMQSAHCFRTEKGEEAYQEAWKAAVAEWHRDHAEAT